MKPKVHTHLKIMHMKNRIYIEKEVLDKHLLIFICLTVITILYIPFISTFFHELGHFISAKAFGFSDARLIVYYPFGGLTIFDFSWSLPFNDPQWVQLKIITIAGSLSGCLSMGLINILVTFYKKIPFSASLPLFVSTLTMIIKDIWYWFSGVNSGSYTYDAYNFINIPPQVNPVVVQYFTIYFGALILILLILGLVYRIKEITKKYTFTKSKNQKRIDLPSFSLLYLILMFSIIIIFIVYTRPLFSLSIP